MCCETLWHFHSEERPCKIFVLHHGVHHLKSRYNRGGMCLLRGTDWIFIYNCSFIFAFKAVPWLRHLAVGLSPRRPGFDLSWVHVRFVVEEVALGQDFSPSTSVFLCPYHFSNASFIFICVLLLLEGEMDEAWEPSKKRWFFVNRETLNRELLPLF